jgi:hypothetical protein
VRMLKPKGQLCLVASPMKALSLVDVMPFSRINEGIERVRGRDVPMGLVLENRD